MTYKTFFNYRFWLLIISQAGLAIVLTSCQDESTSNYEYSNRSIISNPSFYVNSLNKGQQAYFAEKNRFGSSIEVLGVGISTQTINYSYSSYIDSSRKTVKKLEYPHIAIQIGQSVHPEVRSYVGAVWVSQVAGKPDLKILSILCRTKSKGMSLIPVPIVKGEGIMECAPETLPLKFE